ncbi:MAG: Crp/Fnr family transcriptional regulator, partial [Cyanobacteria bacterium J06649_5]
PGTLVGEMAILEHRPHYASAVAKTECTVVSISPTRFRFLIEETPNFAMDVMEIMAERLHLMDRRLALSTGC